MQEVSNIKRDTLNNVKENDPKNQRGSKHCYKRGNIKDISRYQKGNTKNM